MDAIKRKVASWIKGPLTKKNETKSPSKSSRQYLRSLMSRYQTDHLVNTDPEAFKAEIDKFLSIEDFAMEGFKDPAKQRDLAIKFHWGHNHDFGDFSLKGLMGDRHIKQLAVFMYKFGVLPAKLDGKKVLDIGCWTGGTSLLFSAMGAEVVAVEEVKKYVDCLNYLKHAFDVKTLEARNLSLYECSGQDFDDTFDFVLFAGVLYHLSDPVLALRLIFNSLKDGGICLLETAAEESDQSILTYEGPNVFSGGDAEILNRTGWNWFLPSPKALEKMMRDVGFEEIRIGRIKKSPNGSKRVYAVAKRNHHTDIMRSGLSDRRVR